ncbi:MAG: FecR domain-containing protein [Bryobacterales bacterium]|nr:FecR domain-containing protein [Bryobacterales bacterium]
MRRSLWVVVSAGLMAIPTLSFAQEVVSARAGLIHYLEGKVYVADKLVEQTPSTKLFSQFPEVKENQVLRTEAGRAEILLSPGAVLRLGEDSAVKMISNRLIDTRLVLESGSAVVEISDLQKENSITVTVAESTVQFKRTGTYELSANPATVKVFDGQADVIAANDKTQTLKRGQIGTLGETVEVAKFDPEKGDSLTRWSVRRSGYLAMANVSAAKSLRDSGYSWTSGGWNFNPYFGMFTFIPARGVACSSFTGFCYYSPLRINSFLSNAMFYGYPGRMYGYGGAFRRAPSAPMMGGGTMTTVHQRSVMGGGGSFGSMRRGGGGMMSMPGPSAAPAPAMSAPAAGGGGGGATSSVGHGGGGGGGGRGR